MPQFGRGGSGTTGVPRNFKGLPIARGLNDGNPYAAPGQPSTFTDSLAETGAVAETQSATADFVGTVAETGTPSDTQAGVGVFVGAASETITATDTQSGPASFAGSASDALTASDSQAGVAAFAGTASETLTPSAAQLSAADFAGVNAETVTPTAAQSSSADFVGALPETITATDVQTSAASFVGEQTESVGVTESTVGAIDYPVAQSDSVTASDAQAGVVALAVAVSEALSVTASETGAVAFAGATAEALTVADEATSVADFAGVRAEALTVAESADGTADFVAAQADSITVADAATGVIFDAHPPLPAIAALAPGGPGAWWDSTDGLTADAWVDRVNGDGLAVTLGVPVVESNVLNGRAAATFDGSSAFSGAITPVGANPSALSIIALVQRDPVAPSTFYYLNLHDDTGNKYAACYLTSLNGRAGGEMYTDDTGRYVDSDSNDTPATLHPTEAFLFEMYLDDHDATPRFYSNGVEHAIGFDDPPATPFGVFGFSHVTVGAYQPSGPQGFGGRVFLAGTLPVALSVEDRQVVYDWITDVYGLELPRIVEGTEYDVEVAESLSVTDTADATVTTAPSGGGGGIILPRIPKRPGFHVTVVAPPAVRAWVVPPARVVLGDRTAIPDAARLAWVVPSASVALGTTRSDLTPARREWVALAPAVSMTPDPDEELLILSLADGFL